MPELEVVGKDVDLAYPVVTEAGFPYGIMCTECGVPIDIGQPYKRNPTGVYPDGTSVDLLTCVYC